MTERVWILAGLAAVAVAGPLQAGGVPHACIRDGNRAYDAEGYVEAEVQYRKALERESELPEARFDLGDALYRQGRYAPAEGEFQRAGNAPDLALQADASFNRGNALFRQQKYAESIEAYADALRADPGHEDARYNLSVARKRLKTPPREEQPQSGGKEGEKERGDQDSKPSPEGSPPSEGDPSSSPREDGAEEGAERPEAKRSSEADDESAERPAQQPAPGNPGDQPPSAGEPGAGDDSQGRAISPAEAERILQAVRDDEKEVQKKLRARTAGRVNVEKDW